jgi:hypothetical protein
MENLKEKSFVMSVYSNTGDHPEPVTFVDKSDFAGNGWLVRRIRMNPPMTLRFNYAGSDDARLHYVVTAGPGTGEFEGQHLSASRNGYMGFYGGRKDPYWKIELVRPWAEDEEMLFVLRNHAGYRVAACKEKANMYLLDQDDPDRLRHRQVEWLNIYKGNVFECVGRNIQFD